MKYYFSIINYMKLTIVFFDKICYYNTYFTDYDLGLFTNKMKEDDKL